MIFLFFIGIVKNANLRVHIIKKEANSVKKILFIDDENNILKSLKRLFRNTEFECYFASTIAEAIKISCELDGLDMIVSDMKMPYFDGIRTLKLFKEAEPDAIRVALSGYATSSSITEAVSKNLAKQYIHKPWDNNSLVDALTKMFTIEELLKSFNLFKFAQRFDFVKTIPRLFNEINMAIARDQSVESISELVNQDPAIASNILRIANSAFYAAKTGDLQQAIMFIGLNNLKQIVLSYEVANMSDGLFEKSDFIWSHSTRTNLIFHEAYETYFEKKVPAILSTAGLVHDIGKIIMLQIFGESYYRLISTLGMHGGKLVESERNLFGVDHCIVGGYFLNWWAFPYDIIESTMFHHEPDSKNITNQKLVALMCVASNLEETGGRDFNSSYLYALEVLNFNQKNIDDILRKFSKEDL